MTPVAGKVTEADIERAKAHRAALAAENVALQVDLARQKRRRQLLAARLSSLELFQSTREILDHTFGRNGGFFIAVTLGPAVLVLLSSVFSPSALGYVLVILAGIILAAVAYLPFSFFPEDEKLALAIPRVTEKLKEAAVLHERLAVEEATQRERLTAAAREYERLTAAAQSRLHWLRTCHWQEMTGRGLVNFLALALEEHGYVVEPVPRTEKCPIDLIATRDGRRVAMRAAGDPKTAVDELAVQQAQSALTACRCQVAAVVTNSRFTAPARELADRIGCRLIDGSQIPDLIEGRIVL